MTYALETDRGWFSLRRIPGPIQQKRLWMFKYWTVYNSNGEVVMEKVS